MSESMGMNRTGRSKLYTIAIILVPILQQYKLLPLEYVDLLSLLFFIPAFVVLLKRSCEYRFFLYYAYCVVSVLISGMFYPGYYLPGIGLSAVRLIIIYISIFAFAGSAFDFDFGASVFRRIAFLLSCVVIIQYSLYLIAKVPSFLLLPNVTLNYAGGMNSSELIEILKSSVGGGYIFRPSAVFIEPADFGYFITPALIITLFYNKRNNDAKTYITAAIMSVAAILTTSTLALVSCLVIWLLFFYDSGKGRPGYVRVELIVGLALAVAVCVIALQQESVAFSINRKLMQLRNVDAGTSSSTALRLLRGPLYFIHMHFPFNIIGCGFGKLTDYYLKIGMHLKTDTHLNNLSYMSSAFTVLCSEGVIGALLYFVPYSSLLRSKDLLVQRLALLLLALLFAGSAMDSGTYYVMMVFMLSKSAQKQPDKHKLQDGAFA